MFLETKIKKTLNSALLLLVVLLFSSLAQAQSKGRLIVFTTEYCPYCRAFMTEVGALYGKTEIGRVFPLLEVDNHNPPKEFESLSWQIRFFPTFVVMDQANTELARFRGYRGEEFFWMDMEELVNKVSDR
ncbi:MAG: thioredoxin family protein [Magnetococcales bacterium]|nr:thioredoxin family protein [Magnetococcales bacterium]